MALMRWFRRHMRHLLAAMAVVLILGWLVAPALGRLAREAELPVGTVNGEDVTKAEWRDAQGALQIMLSLGMVDPGTLFMMQYMDVTPRTQYLFRLLAGELRVLVFPTELRLSRDAAWRFLALHRAAEAAGIEATLADRRALLAGCPPLVERGAVSQSRYAQFLARFRHTDAQVTRWSIQIVKVLKLMALRTEGCVTSRPERWMDFAYRNEQSRIRFVDIDASLFVPLVEPEEEDLRAFFAEHSENQADPGAGVVGYMAPERVRLEYAIARLEDVLPDVEVTEGEIAAYYEAHREDYRLPEEEPEQDAEAADDAEQEGQEAEGDAEEQQGVSLPEQEEAPDRESEEAEAGESDEPEAPKYKTLEEVRDDIAGELAQEKALVEGKARMEAALDDLRSESSFYAQGPQPVGRMARRHGMVYRRVVMEDGREFVSEEELTALAPLGQEVAGFAFGAEDLLNFPEAVSSPDGPFLICQVLARKDPEKQSYEQVKAQVEQDYRQDRALERAFGFAGELWSRAQETDLDAATKEMAERLAGLLPERQTDADEEPAAPLLQVKESGLFPRVAGRVPGLSSPVPEVVRKAFALAPGESGVVREGEPLNHAYVVQLMERQEAPAEDFARQERYLRVSYWGLKRAWMLNDWMDGLLAQVDKHDENATEQ